MPNAKAAKDEEAAARALEARVEMGRQRATAFRSATQGSSKSGKPGCKPKYPEAKA